MQRGAALRRSRFRPFKLDVPRTRDDGVIAEVTTFGPHLFPAFGLPDVPGKRPKPAIEVRLAEATADGGRLAEPAREAGLAVC